MKYIDSENKRIDLVKQLQGLRNQLIDKDSKGKGDGKHKRSDVKYSTNSSKIGSITNSSMKSIMRKEGSLRGTKELDPEVIKKEKRKAIAKTTKELKGIISKMKLEYALKAYKNNHKENYTCSSKGYRVRAINRTLHDKSGKSARKHKSFIEEQKACQRINDEQVKINQWKKNQNKLMKNRKIIKEIESESNKDRQKVLQRIEDYRRQKLLEKIKEYDERTQTLQEQRTGLNKFRQEMRKNAAYNKYQAKLEIEKITHKLNKEQTQINPQLMTKMFKAAGLGNVWQLANQQPTLSNSSHSPEDLSKLDIYMNLPSLTNTK